MVAALLSAALIFSATPAYAVPSSKTAQARAVKAQVDALDHKVEVAAERYNEASSKHRTLLAQKKKAQSRLKKVEARMDVVQGHLNTRANSMYRTGSMGFVDVLLGAESFEEFSTTWDVLKDLNSSDAEAVAELKGLRAEYRTAHKDLAAKEKAAGAVAASMKKQKQSIESQLAERKRKLSGLEREIAALQAAEERARSNQRYSGRRSSSEGNWRPASSGIGGSIVQIAMTRLGAPYVWGADGPYAFDCSGLTMWVYAQKGIRLPHSSRAQIHVGQRVSRNNLEPGDLVFFGSPIHHVGIYVGGGRYIHAPHTGDVVKISSMNRSDYAGASRP